MCFGLSLFFVYSAVSALIDWPSGCWIAFFVMSASLGLSFNRGIIACDLQSSVSNDDSPCKCHLFIKSFAFFIFFSFLLLQLPLVSSRYTYLVPDFLKAGTPF